MSLRLRLLLMLLLPMTLVVGAYAVVRVRHEARLLADEEQRHVGVTARAVRIAVESALRTRRGPEVQRLLGELVQDQAQVERIRVLLERRRSRPEFVASPEEPEPSPSLTVLQRVIRTRQEEAHVEGGEHAPRLLYRLPISTTRGEVDGAVEITFIRGDSDARASQAMQDLLLRLGILALALAALTGLVLQRQLLRPLSRLTQSIRALGEGRPGPSLPVTRRDELGAVAAAFNRMADQLEAARRRILADRERALDLEQQLRHAETLSVAGKLASGIAHEVGTPLNIISGRAEMMLGSLPADHAAREDVQIIVEQIDRISAIIRALLDTVRLRKPEIQGVPAQPAVTGVLALLEHLARRRGIVLEAQVPPDLPEMAADPAQLQQVLLNLLMNAIEATPEEGRVTVEARATVHGGQPGVSVSVIDTGIGIRPEARSRIFDAFFTTKAPGQGTGLGLAICRDIVRDHGGTIGVQSRPGQGTTFTVWLPQHGTGA